MVTAAIIQCPNQQIKEPYSSFPSYFVLFSFSFYLLLFFETIYNYLLHNWAVLSGGRKSIVPQRLLSGEDTQWYMCEGIALSGQDT